MLRRLFNRSPAKRKIDPPPYRFLPELAGLPPEEQDRVWEASARLAWRHPGLWVLAGVGGSLLWVAPIVASRMLAREAAAVVTAYCPWLPARLLPLVAVLVLLLVPPLVGASLVIRIGPRLIRRYVPRCLPGHCPRCGYDLRATPERCPECGRVPAR